MAPGSPSVQICSVSDLGKSLSLFGSHFPPLQNEGFGRDALEGAFQLFLLGFEGFEDLLRDGHVSDSDLCLHGAWPQETSCCGWGGETHPFQRQA